MITEEELRAHLEELRAKQKAHVLEVRTEDGRLVDLDTLVAEAPAPLPMEPHPVLDSVANDIPTGIQFPKYQGDQVLNKEQVQDVVAGMAEVDGKLQVDPLTGEAVVVPEDAEVPPVPVPEEDELEVAEEDEEELAEPEPGIPPPPPPAGGMPRNNNKQNKKHRR
jgi:hypothetical protein